MDLLTMETKSQLAEIEKGCDYYDGILERSCGDILFDNTIYLCPTCQTAKKYFLLGTISQLKIRKDDLKSYLEHCDECGLCGTCDRFTRDKINKITADLKFYEDKLKEVLE